MTPAARVLIFGYGYVARFLAKQLVAQKVATLITTRDPGSFHAIRALGCTPLQFGEPLPTLTHAVLTVPPEHTADPVLTRYGVERLKATGLTWLGYLSTTGVYGDTNGGAVDEKSPLLAQTERGRARVLIEKTLLGSGLPVEVFRLSGIYGPGRNMIERLQQNNVADLEISDRPVNRIHVDDIVAAVMAAMNKPSPGAIYNVSDDHPAPTRDVLHYAAALLGMDSPGGGGRSHLMDGSRVVLNDKIKTALGVRLKYPTYREGLAALARDLGL